MDIVKHLVSSSGALAKGIGNGSVGLARTIGLKRGLIGLAAVGAVAGAAVVLVRFLKTRGDDLTEEQIASGVIRRKPNKAKRDRQNHAVAH